MAALRLEAITGTLLPTISFRGRILLPSSLRTNLLRLEPPRIFITSFMRQETSMETATAWVTDGKSITSVLVLQPIQTQLPLQIPTEMESIILVNLLRELWRIIVRVF